MSYSQICEEIKTKVCAIRSVAITGQPSIDQPAFEDALETYHTRGNALVDVLKQMSDTLESSVITGKMTEEELKAELKRLMYGVNLLEEMSKELHLLNKKMSQAAIDWIHINHKTAVIH